MSCKRCNGTGSIVEYHGPDVYEWPPIKCGVCNPKGEFRDNSHEVDIPCPDCAVTVICDECGAEYYEMDADCPVCSSPLIYTPRAKIEVSDE